MTYDTDNRKRKDVQSYGFLSFAKKVCSKYRKKFVNNGISPSKSIKTAATKFNQSEYGKTLKKEGSKIDKMAGKQVSEKNILAAVDLAGSKIADKITSLKVSEEELHEQD